MSRNVPTIVLESFAFFVTWYYRCTFKRATCFTVVAPEPLSNLACSSPTDRVISRCRRNVLDLMS